MKEFHIYLDNLLNEKLKISKVSNKINGTKVPRVSLSKEAIVMIRELLPRIRAEFRKDAKANETDPRNSEFYYGERFNGDDRVIERIESGIKDESEFLKSPEDWIYEALRDCASADHWYKFKKDWD